MKRGICVAQPMQAYKKTLSSRSRGFYRPATENFRNEGKKVCFSFGLPEIFPVIRRGFAHDHLKIMVKICEVVVSALVTNLGNLFIGFGQ